MSLSEDHHGHLLLAHSSAEQSTGPSYAILAKLHAVLSYLGKELRGLFFGFFVFFVFFFCAPRSALPSAGIIAVGHHDWSYSVLGGGEAPR